MGKLNQVVLAIIFNDEGKVLLSKRFEPRNKLSHDKWQFPGGGMEKGESMTDAVIREVWEEANISIKLLTHKPITIKELRSHIQNQYILLHGFPASFQSGTISCKNDPESSEIGWFEYDEIDFSNTLPGTQKLIDKCLLLWKSN